METYTVKIVIENKPGINDPEGETILHDLILKGSDSKIKDVRVAKMLTVKVQEKSRFSMFVNGVELFSTDKFGPFTHERM